MTKKRKKNGGRGKAKGGQFERTICKRLSLWVTHGKKEDVFWRSAMSGGRATIAASKGKELRRQAGDICAVAPEGHALTDRYFFELKHYKDLAIDSFFLKQTGTLANFWVKACREAAKYDKQPFMIVCQNNMPIMVITRLWALDPVVKCPGNLHHIELTSKKFAVQLVWFDELLKHRFTGKGS